MTVIIVAHRLSTVRHCDSVAYLDEGALIGLGPFEDLARSSPGFAEMVRIGRLDAPTVSPRD